MEVILNCFFEKFEQLERDNLHARYKRRIMVEYFNTLIEGCRLGQECEAEKIVREAVIGILRYHENSRNMNGKVCMMGKYHNVLYVAVKLCYDWQLKDTQTVATLLDHIYSCEKTFERIFIGAIFGIRAPYYIAGWKSDFESQEENLRAVVYFLDHARKANLEYPFENEQKVTRFIDVPVESCGRTTALKVVVQLGLPDKLHILLRFGALVILENEHEPIVEILLTRLDEFKRCYPYNLVACLQLLLRVLRNIIITPKSESILGSNVRRDAILERFPELVEDGIIPASRCGIQPTELKHLCRCSIRYMLWKNFQLPNGIRKLNVPKSLQKYLDLLED